MRRSAYFGLELEFGSEVKLEALWLTSLFKLLCAVQQSVRCAVHESWCVGGDVMSLAAWTQADSTQSVACGW